MLSDVVKEFSCRNKDLRVQKVYSVTNSDGFVPSQDYFSKDVFSKDLSNYKIVRKGMLAYNPSRINVGSVACLQSEDEVIVSPLYVVVEVNEKKLLAEYLNLFLHSDIALEQIKSLTSGSVRDSLKYNDFTRLCFPLPSVETQQAVIEKLSAVKKLIAKREQQLSKLDQLAKSIVFVGDSNQFPPVIDMKPLRNDFLKTKNKITKILDQRYDFLKTAAFDLSFITPILLKEHFRCAEEISDYFNDAFYANELHIRTDANKLKTPVCMGYRHAVEWIDVHNSNVGEIEAVERTLKTLINNDYPGTIGVITPFKKYAEDLKERLYPLTSSVQKKDDDSKILINTANGFQGGERDVILFVLGYNDELTKGKLWYAESPENRYIYNVAVSRARACLIIIGDKARCATSSVSVLKKLSDLPRPKKTRVPGTLFDSILEKKLYEALCEAGIETQPQYPVMGRRLDLAVIRGDLKIDIEIDGVHYHTDNDGNRKLDDIYRDLQVAAGGWKVKRFWVYELRDNMNNCVKQIAQIIESNKDIIHIQKNQA